MSDLLRLRCQDPATLSEAELRRAVARVVDDRAALGPERMSRLLRAGRDRLGLDWKALSDLSGYPLPTTFSLTRAARNPR
ncbi:hypothetical protein GCM10009836_52110 [Pseudonocardia ailaonensis]|uniref:Uncharacterized protein n=1 Tax=Pseudonocardia ailaonensis TaxID=367279 RepID=A0ABN2NEH4_9PSEU